MATVMMDASYAPVREAYVAARDHALDAALRAVGPETPPLGTLQSLQPDTLERIIAGWIRRLRALVLLALRCSLLQAGGPWWERACEGCAHVAG
jgi:hypothetical protein